MAVGRDNGVRDAVGANRGQPSSGRDGNTRDAAGADRGQPNRGTGSGAAGWGGGPGQTQPRDPAGPQGAISGAPGQGPGGLPGGGEQPGNSSFTGDPVFDQWLNFIALIAPGIGTGIAATKALQALGLESTPSDVDNNQRGSATGNDGGTGDRASRMFPSMQDDTTGQPVQAPQTANAPAVNVNNTVNNEVGRILQQQQQQAAMRRQTALTGGGAQGLTGPANTAGVQLVGF